jgi:hypothetical protein
MGAAYNHPNVAGVLRHVGEMVSRPFGAAARGEIPDGEIKGRVWGAEAN